MSIPPLRSWPRHLVHLGCTRAGEARAARRMVLTNAISLTLAMMTAPYAVLFGWLGAHGLARGVIVVTACYLSVPGFLALGLFTAGRSFFLLVFNVAILIYAGFLGTGTGIQLLYFPAVCLPIILADIRERGFVLLGIALPVVLFAALELAPRALLPAPVLDAAAQRWVYLALVPTTFALLLCAVLYFFIANQRAEARAEQRTRDLQVVLDNIGQGFLTLDREGRLGREWSRAAAEWLGSPRPGQRFADFLAGVSPPFAARFRVGFELVREGELPLALTVEQLPRALQIGERHLRFDYRTICAAEDVLEQAIVVIADVTDEVERQRAEQEQQEVLAIFDRVLRDPTSFAQFCEETDGLLRQLRGATSDRATRLRALHTLKGNSGLFGALGLAAQAHAIEERVRETGEAPTASEVDALAAAWVGLVARLSPILHRIEPDVVTLTQEEHRAFLASLAARRPHGELLYEAATWSDEPVGRRLLRLAEQARSLARRLGKGEIRVQAEGGALRVPMARFAPLFASLGHLVRNCVDHGLEAEEERLRAGKPGAGCLVLRAERLGDELVLEIEDDGRGIDWARVAAQARRHGLRAETRGDLEAALFADGVSTQQEVNEISGRGLGMAAVRAALEDIGGRIEIHTQAGMGTRFRCRATIYTPREDRDDRRAMAPAARAPAAGWHDAL